MRETCEEGGIVAEIEGLLGGLDQSGLVTDYYVWSSESVTSDLTGYAFLSGGFAYWAAYAPFAAEALQEAQVDQDVDQGVEVSDGGAVADVRALDAEGDGLAVDAFDGGALVVDVLVLSLLRSKV